MFFSDRWLELRIYAREWAKPVGAVVTLSALAVFLYVMLYRHSEQELHGAMVEHGYATVERVTLTSKGSKSIDLIRVLTLRINDQDVIFPTNTAFSTGEVVRISYRVGASGKVYVDDVYSATDR